MRTADARGNPDHRRELRLSSTQRSQGVGAGRHRRRGAADLLEVTAVTTGVIYLLYFDRPFGHARHYLGSAVQLEQRLDEHHSGSSARLIFWAARAGLSGQLTRTWAGGRPRERQLKAQGGHSRHGPICRPPRRPGRCQS
ncbi:MAG: hypothetical protein M3Y62_06555 [Candidatus Dormibacteraeota bacterium]|nr:hypothetical protein [Candidatus Dormibacteraeota bacterium]